MDNPFGLIYQCIFNSIQDLEIANDAINSQKEKWIWIKGEPSAIIPHIETINKSIKKTEIKLFCESEELIEKGLAVNALIIPDFNEILSTKKRHTDILVGGIANDLACAKNIEHFKGDFVFLGPIDEIGENPYITIIPEKPDYEWRFIDIIIPVIGFGAIEQKRLNEFTELVDFSGFACTHQDFAQHFKSKLRFPVI